MLGIHDSMLRRPEQFDGLKPNRDRGETATNAESDIKHRRREETAPDKKQCFVTESRKGGEAAKQSSEKEKARLVREQVVMLNRRRDQSNDQATEDVHAKSADWEAPRLGLVENDSAEFVAGNRTHRSAKRDHENLFTVQHAEPFC
jgi:hypothetical protein